MTSIRSYRSTLTAARPSNRPSDWRFAFACVKSSLGIGMPEQGHKAKTE